MRSLNTSAGLGILNRKDWIPAPARVIFLVKTLYFKSSLSTQPRVKIAPGGMSRKLGKLLGMDFHSIQAKKQYSWSLHAMETGIRYDISKPMVL